MVAIVTYVYPSGIKYLNSFLIALSNQSCKEFELIIFNDGVECLEDELVLLSVEFRIKVIPIEGSIAKVRFLSFDILKNEKHTGFIFQDIDDIMSVNRVGVCADLLKENEIVVNDLLIMGKEEVQYGVWGERIEDLNEILLKDLIRSNVIGLGNSSIRSDVLRRIPIKRSELPIAVDWFIFYQLLYFGIKACFTTRCYTIYRQHEDNVAGMTNMVTKDRFSHILQVKRNHYTALQEIGMGDFSNELSRLEKKEIDGNIQLFKNPFWWEETELI